MSWNDMMRARMQEVGKHSLQVSDCIPGSEEAISVEENGGMVWVCQCGELSTCNGPCSCHEERMELASYRKQQLQAHAQKMAVCSQQGIAAYAVCIASDLLAGLRGLASDKADDCNKTVVNESLVMLQELAKLLGVTNSFVDTRNDEEGDQFIVG